MAKHEILFLLSGIATPAFSLLGEEEEGKGGRGLLRHLIVSLFLVQFLSTPDCLVFRDFSWSPTDNKIAWWVPGRDSIPAKITIEMPSRKEVSTKSRHEVSEVGAFRMAQLILGNRTVGGNKTRVVG